MAYKIGKDITKKSYYQYQNKVQNDSIIVSESGEVNNDISETTEKDYVGVVKKVKKDNITSDNIGEIMLCQIPGISSVTALAVMENSNLFLISSKN